MSKSSSSRTGARNYGLRLTLPGAPEGVAHTLAGLPGVYYTDRVTPVGGEGEPTLAQARDAAKGADAPVKVEEVGPIVAERLRDEQPETIDEVAAGGQED